MSGETRYVDEIIFPESWKREENERLERYHAEQRARRLAELRHRLQAGLPSFMVRPGSRECWGEEDAAIVQDHAQTLAALLKLSNMDRGKYANPLALRAALILHAPLLEAGPEAIGLLSLRSPLFVGVVDALDRQQQNTHGKESD